MTKENNYMKLDGLIPLFNSMRSQGIQRYKFNFRKNDVTFDVFFFTDESPFILLFGVRIKNFSFVVEVQSGFLINDKLPRETYKKLCEILGIKYDPLNKFSPFVFFNEFNKAIPAIALESQRASSQDISIYKRDVEDADKIYFYGWNDNTKDGGQVTEKNLLKTREYLGYKAYEWCRKKNISSRWTDREEYAKEALLRL